MKANKLLPLFLLIVCFSCGNNPDYHFVEIQGKKQYVLTWGEGEPIVVFLNGGGSSLEDFKPVQSEISGITKTISYDKPGLGKSELTDVPRTLENATEDLRAILKKEKAENAPVVLVGHSMGGFVARYYLYRYPQNVVGMVLIDPGSEYLEDEWRKVRTEAQLKEEDSLLAEQIKLIPRGFQMEVLQYHEHDSILKSINPETNIPITLIESNKVEKGDDDGRLLIQIQKRLYRDFQRSLPQTKLISTESSGHFIQLDEPQLVIDAIKEILTKVQ